jgi:hypothetical protein
MERLRPLVEFLQTKENPELGELEEYFSVQLSKLGSGASKTAYRHPSLPFVLKWGGEPRDEYRRAQKSPILQKLYLFPVFLSDRFMIQPLVDRRDTGTVLSLISGRVKSLSVDLHEGNVGRCNGRPVLIDI